MEDFVDVGSRPSGGEQVASFDGSGLSSGVYFYRIVTVNSIATGRMVSVK